MRQSGAGSFFSSSISIEDVLRLEPVFAKAQMINGELVWVLPLWFEEMRVRAIARGDYSG